MIGNFAPIYIKFKRYDNNGQVFIDFASTLEVGRLNFFLFYLSPPSELSSIQPSVGCPHMARIDQHLLRQLSAGCCDLQSIMMNYSARRLSISINANQSRNVKRKKLSRPCHGSIQAFKQKYHIAMRFRSEIQYRRRSMYRYESKQMLNPGQSTQARHTL